MKRVGWLFVFFLAYGVLFPLPGHGQPVPPETIRFNHQFHVGDEVGLECASCHKAAESTSAQDRILPGMELCGECHDIDDEEQCVLCHLDMDRLGQVAVPEREIMFSHQAHLEYEGLECVTCHAGMQKKEKTGGPQHLPEMATCTTCHAGKQAPDECAACHTDLMHLRPESHTQNWVHEHGRRVRTGDTSCAPCHSQPECQECHEGARISVSVPTLGTQASFAPQSRGDAGLILKRNHDLNYRFTHMLDAKGKERECATCHELSTFCAECHRPNSNPDFFKPAWHGGPDWGAIAGAVGSGGGRHADLARRDMERCAACHDSQGDDPVCMLCHMDRTPGLGNDPSTHGSRFKSQQGFGNFHDDPNAICYNCHISSSSAAAGKALAGGPGFCGYCHGPK